VLGLRERSVNLRLATVVGGILEPNSKRDVGISEVREPEVNGPPAIVFVV